MLETNGEMNGEMNGDCSYAVELDDRTARGVRAPQRNWAAQLVFIVVGSGNTTAG
jgi:hypothetical protein